MDEKMAPGQCRSATVTVKTERQVIVADFREFQIAVRVRSKGPNGDVTTEWREPTEDDLIELGRHLAGATDGIRASGEDRELMELRMLYGRISAARNEAWSGPPRMFRERVVVIMNDFERVHQPFVPGAPDGIRTSAEDRELRELRMLYERISVVCNEPACREEPRMFRERVVVIMNDFERVHQPFSGGVDGQRFLGTLIRMG